MPSLVSSVFKSGPTAVILFLGLNHEFYRISNFDVRTTWTTVLAELFLETLKILTILDEVSCNLEPLFMCQKKKSSIKKAIGKLDPLRLEDS